MKTQYFKAEVNPTIGTDAYTANDVVGGLLTFDVANLINNGGIVNQVWLVDEDSQAEAYTLYLFDEQPSSIADDAAFAPTVADLNKLVAVISIGSGDYTTVNSIDFAVINDVNDTFYTTSGELYGYLVADDTPDYTNDDALTIRLYGLA
jgi:hypothetical protein